VIVRAFLSPLARRSTRAPGHEVGANGSSLAPPAAAGDVVHIRRAEPYDAYALVELARAVEGEEEGWLLGAQEWRDVRAARRYLSDARGRWDRAVLLAEDGGETVGRLSLIRGRHPATAHVATLAVIVARERRRRGIGRTLMEAAEAWARAVGVSKLELSVFVHNAPAITLYERLGYRREGVRRRHLRRGDDFLDVLLMGKELAPKTGDGSLSAAGG
jgi:RimJ/RimL family protein N-acetyltransferase